MLAANHYALPAARLGAIYQLPTPPGHTSGLELHLNDAGKVLDEDWPIESLISCRLTAAEPNLTCRRKGRIEEIETSIYRPLPFQSGIFDFVILHHLLDELVLSLPDRSARVVVDDFLGQLATLLRPGGLIVGCAANATSPRNWFKTRTVLSAMSCRKALLRAGYTDPAIFSLIPDSTTPRAVYSIEPSASRRAFSRELDAIRGQLSLPSYLIRKAGVTLRLNQFIEDSIFFWGYKPC